MNKTVYWAAGVLLTLALAGCSAPTGQTEAPVLEPTLTATSEPTDAEVAFDAAIRFVPGLENVDSAQALAVGYEICDELSKGTPATEIALIDNADQETNEEAVLATINTLCVEYKEVAEAAINDRRFG